MDKILKRAAQDQRLPLNLPKEDFNQLSEKPGVYYFYNQVKKWSIKAKVLISKNELHRILQAIIVQHLGKIF